MGAQKNGRVVELLPFIQNLYLICEVKTQVHYIAVLFLKFILGTKNKDGWESLSYYPTHHPALFPVTFKKKIVYEVSTI